VPLAGVFAIVGGLSVLLGYKARLGAWSLVIFLIPVTFYMHAFWKIADPRAAAEAQIQFLKNISMLGAALVLTQLEAVRQV
jgi:putative oxidoreductase